MLFILWYWYIITFISFFNIRVNVRVVLRVVLRVMVELSFNK